MTSQTPIGPESPQLERRTVRDIVEYSPDQVGEVWCRKIFRQILQSLELQYAMHMPHRVITPDTVVFHDNGEPLLIPSDMKPPLRKDGAPDDPLRDDLLALAGVIHYAITGELTPDGPLRGRVPDGYSDSLVTAVDRCMAPDPGQRPHTIDEVRDILGIVPLGLPIGERPLPDALLMEEALAPTASDGPPFVAPPFVAPVFVEPAAVAPAIAPAFVPAPAPPLASAEPAAVAQASEPAAPVAAAAPIEPVAPVAPVAAAAPSPSIASADPATAAGPTWAAQPVDKAAAPVPPQPRASAGPAARPIVATSDTARQRHGAGLSQRQRWAIAAGGGAVLAAFALVMFAELRDSGSYDHIALTLPQRADVPAGSAPLDAAPPAPPAPAAAPTAPLAQSAQAGLGTSMGPAAPASHGAVAGAAMPDGAASANGAPNADGASAAGDMQNGPGEVAGISPTSPTSPTGAAGANYRLQIQPWGVVYVDGIDRGVSPPIKRLALTPGRHTVRVSNPNFQDRTLELDTASGDGRIAIDFGKDAD